VRHYLRKPIADEAVEALRRKIAECNEQGGLHMQLVLNEPKGFSGLFAYGSFSGVENYVVVACRKSGDVDEAVGYYGEQVVLLAQQLGLGTCWAGLSYRKIGGAFTLAEGERVACMIAIGYPDDPGRKLRRKSVEDVSNASAATPDWFRRGVEAALKAPTAVNQQKFRFEYSEAGGKPTVSANRLFSLVGYTKIDLGIAKLHFEIASGYSF
jgi:hypothetical protein